MAYMSPKQRANGEMTCPCGCRRSVKPGNRFAASGCSGRLQFRQDSPQMRAWKSLAGRANAREAQRRVLAECDGLEGPAAFKRGYALGYRRASAKWQRWAEQQVRRSA